MSENPNIWTTCGSVSFIIFPYSRVGGRSCLFNFCFIFILFPFHLVLFPSMLGKLLFECVKNPFCVGFHREDLIIWCVFSGRQMEN